MADKCENCTEKCPQAERARNAALGRMYATNEFVSLLKKVESGVLVEVVRCKNCKHGVIDTCTNRLMCAKGGEIRPNGHVWGGTATKPEHFCSYGERRDGE